MMSRWLVEPLSGGPFVIIRGLPGLWLECCSVRSRANRNRPKMTEIDDPDDDPRTCTFFWPLYFTKGVCTVSPRRPVNKSTHTCPYALAPS